MKFLHTADWQLGAKALQAGPRAPEVRKRRLQAVEKVVEVARNEDVDFVLLAGDTFECHDVDDVVVREAVRLLNRLGGVNRPGMSWGGPVHATGKLLPAWTLPILVRPQGWMSQLSR